MLHTCAMWLVDRWCTENQKTFLKVKTGFSICGLKSMDIWSLAMIFFELLNPNTYAYQHEIGSSYPHRYNKK